MAVTDPAQPYAKLSQQLDPSGQNQAEQQFIQDETEGFLADNANGILPGFKFPPNMTQGDLMNLVNQMEKFASSTGYKYLPNSKDVLNAWKAGATDFASTAKLWSAKLPAKYGYLRHGYTADQFSAYKESNRQQIMERYGVHGAEDDLNYIHNLDNPQPLTHGGGSAFGGQSNQVNLTQRGAVR